MYNRYTDGNGDYARVTGEPEEAGPKGPAGLFSGGGSKGKEAVYGLLKGLGLEGVDLGDILLVLIVVLLILEDGDDLELVIALGLTLLFHLGGSSCA